MALRADRQVLRNATHSPLRPAVPENADWPGGRKGDFPRPFGYRRPRARAAPTAQRWTPHVRVVPPTETAKLITLPTAERTAGRRRVPGMRHPQSVRTRRALPGARRYRARTNSAEGRPPQSCLTRPADPRQQIHPHPPWRMPVSIHPQTSAVQGARRSGVRSGGPFRSRRPPRRTAV